MLITRPRAQSTTLVEAVERHGGRAIVHPAIAIAPPEDAAPLRTALQHLDRYDWLLLTSANAAQALVAGAQSKPRSVACVGASTARVCEMGGIPVDLVPPDFNAEALLAALTARLGDTLPRTRFLFLAAAEGRDTLPEGLRQRAAQVDVVVAYRTIPALDEADALLADLRAAAVDLLTFASPSAVEAFDLMSGAGWRHLPAVCIGQVTARRATALGYAAAVPARADTEGIVAALVALATSK